MAQKIRKEVPKAPQQPLKKIVKKPLPKKIVVEEVEDSVAQNEFQESLEGTAQEKRMPEALSVAMFELQAEREKRVADIRQVAYKNYTPPSGWRVIKTIEFDNTNEGFARSVEKELTFYLKTQPEGEFEVVRLPYLGLIIRKGVPKTNQKARKK